MASAAAHGSDSHDAPLLFVLLCESGARLCLPRPFLSARCLRGKVLLFSFSSALDLSHSSIHTLQYPFDSAVYVFHSVAHCFYLPRARCRPALLLKLRTHSHCLHSYRNFFPLFFHPILSSPLLLIWSLLSLHVGFALCLLVDLT